MNHPVASRDGPLDVIQIANISGDELRTTMREMLRRHARQVEDANRDAALGEVRDDMRADESRSARDENGTAQRTAISLRRALGQFTGAQFTGHGLTGHSPPRRC